MTRSVSLVSAAPEWRHYPCLFAALQTHAGEPGGGGGGAIKIWIKNKDSDRTNIESVTQCLICLFTTQEDGWTKERTASSVFVSSLHDDWITETLEYREVSMHLSFILS